MATHRKYKKQQDKRGNRESVQTVGKRQYYLNNREENDYDQPVGSSHYPLVVSPKANGLCLRAEITGQQHSRKGKSQKVFQNGLSHSGFTFGKRKG